MNISITFQKVDVPSDLEELAKDLKPYDGKLVAVKEAHEPNLLLVGKMIVDGSNRQVYYLTTEDESGVITRPFRYTDISEFFADSSK